jgi:hypothetical protein
MVQVIHRDGDGRLVVEAARDHNDAVQIIAFWTVLDTEALEVWT